MGVNLTEQYVLKIWDETAREIPIFEGSDLLIGQFEGWLLIVRPGYALFRRCLSYQSLWAAAKHLGGEFKASSLNFRLDSLDIGLIKICS